MTDLFWGRMNRRTRLLLTAKWWLWRLRIIACEGCGHRWQRHPDGAIDCPSRVETLRGEMPHAVAGIRRHRWLQ